MTERAPWFSAVAKREVVRPARDSVTRFAPYVMISPDERDEFVAVAEAAQSLYAGLTCANDPMDVDERIARLGGVLSEAANSHSEHADA